MSLRRSGLTLIELLVVIGIVGLLAALSLNSLMSARETGRRLTCINNLKQIGLGAAAYSAQHDFFPPINSHSRINSDPRMHDISAHSFSLFARILPYVEQGAIFNGINFTSIPTFDTGLGQNATVMTATIGLFLCPSDTQPNLTGFGRTNYRVNIGSTVLGAPFTPYPSSFSGPFTAHETYRPADFANGLSVTVGFSERLQGDWIKGIVKSNGDYQLHSKFPFHGEPTPARTRDACAAGNLATRVESRGGESWFLSGLHFTNYNHVALPNDTRLNCAFDDQTEGLHERSLHHGIFPASSYHSHGVNVATMDGSVHFITNRVNLLVWEAIGTRAARGVVSPPW